MKATTSSTTSSEDETESAGRERGESFSFILKTPPASVLIAKAADIQKGSSQPNSESVGCISREQLREIAQIKIQDLNTNDIDKAMSIVSGTANSMGVQIVN